MPDAAQAPAATTPAQAALELGLQARRRGDRIGALAHFRAAAAVGPSLRLEYEIIREKVTLGLE